MWYKEEGISKECIEIYDVERQGKTYTQQTKKKKKASTLWYPKSLAAENKSQILPTRN
jgi:hypothetical protein